MLSFLPLQFCQHAANNDYSFILYIIPIYQTSKHNFVLQCCFTGAKWVQSMCFHTDKTPPLSSYDIIVWGYCPSINHHFLKPTVLPLFDLGRSKTSLSEGQSMTLTPREPGWVSYQYSLNRLWTKKLKYSESGRTKGSFISNIVIQVFGLISLAKKKKRFPLPTTLNLGFNLLIQGSLHESALFFKVWVGRMNPNDQTGSAQNSNFID